MADRVVKLKLEVETQGAIAGFRNASKSAQDFGSKAGQYIDRNRDSINTLSNTLGLFGAAAVGITTLAVRSFMNFDQAMANVKATGEDAAASISDLRDAAIDAGARTSFSATEAANAIEEMAKAGVSAADILSGGLDGALDLAAAGQLDVAQAAGIASTVMNQFGLKGKDVTRIADVLAASAGKANGEVSDFGLAMKYVGPVAAQLGVSLEETSGTLALLAQNGLLADSAGTGLRGVMMSLTAPTKAAQTELDKYGISAFNAQGEFVGLASLAGQLHDKLGGLTEAERSAALGRMFGNEQITTARVLYAQGAEAVQDWTQQVNDSGYAAEVAATKMDNLAGDWEGFTGALETAMIGAGEGANGPLRSLVQTATDVVNAFSDLPSSVQQGATAIVGGGGLVALGLAGLGKLIVGVRDVQKAAQDMGIAFKSAAPLAAGIGVALGVATYIAADLAKRTQEAKERIQAYADTLDDLGNRTKDTAQVISDALSIKRDGGTLMDWADEAGISLDTVKKAIEGNADAWKVLQDAEASALQHSYDGGDAQAKAANIGNIVDAVQDEQKAWREAEKAVADKKRADEAAGVASRDLESQTNDTTIAVDTLTQAIDDNREAQEQSASAALGLRDAQRGLEAAIDDAEEALAKNGATLDINTAKGRENQAALDRIAESNAKVITGMRENGATQAEMQAAVTRSRDEYIRMATAMGMSADEANALADQIGLIPSQVPVNVTTNAPDATQKIRWLGDAINSIDRYLTVDIVQRWSQTGAQVYSASGGMGGTATQRKALGGAIYGGVPGRDSVPVMAMPGEHMLTVSDVNAMGGQAGVYAFRAALHRYGQVPGYANGGPVSTTAAPAANVSAGWDAVVARLDRLERALITHGEQVAAGTLSQRDRSIAGTRSTRGREW